MAAKVNVVRLTTKKGNATCYVSYPDGGTRKKKYFATLTGDKGAEKWAAKKRGELEEKGNQHAAVTDAEFQAVVKFREALKKLPEAVQDATLSDAVDHYLKHLKIKDKSMTCEDLVKKLRDELDKDGVSSRHDIDLKSILGKFTAKYPNWLACDVTTEVVSDFLEGLKVATQTRNNYRRKLNQLFNYGVRIGACIENPCTGLKPPKSVSHTIETLTPKQLNALLNAADGEIVPALAISFFAGVRRAEITRLDWDEIDLEENFIEIKQEKAKTSHRRIVYISDNLKAWLKPYKQVQGAVMPPEAKYRELWEEARKKAGIKKWPNNAGRHSFASYHLAYHEEIDKTAIQLGHTKTDILFKHYNKQVLKKAAEKYWAIYPDSEGKIAQISEAS